MAKESGIGWSVAVDDSAASPQTISNDITNLSVGTPRAEQDITGIDKLGHERLLLLVDMTETLNGVFNDAANMSHAVFKTVPSTSVTRTYTNVISGQTLAGELLPTDYALTRAADGSLTWSVPAVLANGATIAWS